MLFEPQKHRITERIGLEWTLKPTEFQWAGNFGFALFPHKNWWVCRRSRSRLFLDSCSDLRKSRHISAWQERGWFQQHQLHPGHVGVSWTHPAGLTCAPWRGRAEGETAPVRGRKSGQELSWGGNYPGSFVPALLRKQRELSLLPSACVGPQRIVCEMKVCTKRCPSVTWGTFPALWGCVTRGECFHDWWKHMLENNLIVGVRAKKAPLWSVLY